MRPIIADGSPNENLLSKVTGAADASGWTYGRCPLSTEPAAFGLFEDLVQIWRTRLAPGDLLPTRRSFTAEEFLPWLGRIFIARIERDPFNLRFTLWGTQLTDWWGVDYTDRLLGEQSLDPSKWQEELSYFTDMDAAPFIGVATGYLSQHRREFIRVVGLDLPMGDETGLTHVLSAHIRIDLDAALHELFPGYPVFPVPD